MLADMICHKGCARPVAHLLKTETPVIFLNLQIDSKDVDIPSPIQSYAVPMLAMYPL